MHFSAASTVANLIRKETEKKDDCMRKKKHRKNIQHETIPALAITHMPRERSHATYLAKRRSHRQQLVLWEMRGQSVNIHIRGPSLRIHSDTGTGARGVLSASIRVLEGRKRIRVEEEGSAGLRMGLSVEIDLGEWDGWLSGRSGERRGSY